MPRTNGGLFDGLYGKMIQFDSYDLMHMTVSLKIHFQIWMVALSAHTSKEMSVVACLNPVTVIK